MKLKRVDMGYGMIMEYTPGHRDQAVCGIDHRLDSPVFEPAVKIAADFFRSGKPPRYVRAMLAACVEGISVLKDVPIDREVPMDDGGAWDNEQALNELYGNIDWKLFHDQKAVLVALAGATRCDLMGISLEATCIQGMPSSASVHPEASTIDQVLDGVIGLLDCFQDVAADRLGIEEAKND